MTRVKNKQYYFGFSLRAPSRNYDYLLAEITPAQC